MIIRNQIIRNLSTPSIFLILVNLLSSVSAQVLTDQICQNNGNYTSNSTYQTNLNTLLSNLSATIDSNGYYTASVGQSPDRVNGLVLCRGDIQLDVCRSCVQGVATEIVELCTNNRQAMMWYETCMLRYSDASFLGIMDFEPYSIMRNIENSTNPDDLMSDLGTLLNRIRDQASSRGPSMKLAIGDINTTNFQTLFALVQCTPNLSPGDCEICLRSAASRLATWSYGRIGARSRLPSCNIRYETRSFYNATRVEEIFPQTSPVPSPPPPPPPPQPDGNGAGNGDSNSNTNPTRTIIIVVVSVVVGLTMIVFFGCFLRKMNQNSSALEGEALEGISTVESLQYDFGIIKAATHDFSEDNKLGQGGFGAVYKGKLPNGQEIAVKRLSKGSGQGDSEFKNEVMLLAKLQHRNLVRLLGYSLEGSEKLLVYEFIQNASLDSFIFDPTKRSFLDWHKRYKIIVGIVRGILYLHEDSRLTIIHRDLKAGNILLDGDMRPKIADFGMARLFVQDETHAITRKIAGTYGYMAPEYAMRGQFSVKSDVFSFGVLLLEIISGQKSNCFIYGENEKDLLSHAWDNWCNGTAANLVDPVLNFGSSIPRDILRCIHIGLLCVQENAVDRPTMASIITMLSNLSIILSVPSQPAFYVRGGYDSKTSFKRGEGNFYRSAENGDSVSQNEMSISEFQAR